MLNAFDMDVKNGAESAGGFLVRDLLRFMAVDIILILALRLCRGLGIFPDIPIDPYVLAVLGSKVILFVYLVWLIRDRRDAWPETGGDTAGVWWAWPAALVFYAGCYPFMIWADRLNQYLMRELYEWLGWVYEPQLQEVMVLIFADILDSPTRMVLIFFTVVGGPLMEEIAFRGIGLDALRRRVGTGWGLILTSLLFGLYHFSMQMLLPLTLMGVVFGAVRIVSKSLWCAIAIHCFHNTLVLVIMAHNLGVLEKWKFW